MCRIEVGYDHPTFDSLGRKSTVVDGHGTVTYSYDVDSRTTSIADSLTGTVNYEYQQSTGRLTRTYTSSTDTRYGYDELGRIKTVSAYKLAGAD